jgi:hypothetical protein
MADVVEKLLARGHAATLCRQKPRGNYSPFWTQLSCKSGLSPPLRLPQCFRIDTETRPRCITGRMPFLFFAARPCRRPAPLLRPLAPHLPSNGLLPTLPYQLWNGPVPRGFLLLGWPLALFDCQFVGEPQFASAFLSHNGTLFRGGSPVNTVIFCEWKLTDAPKFGGALNSWLTG